MPRIFKLGEKFSSKKIKLIVFDFDGVMTDNRVLVNDKGSEAVFCHRADGLGIDALRKAKIPAIVLSTEKNPVVAARCKKLRLKCYQGVMNKKDLLKKYLSANKINAANVAYVGNDINDLACFKLVGLAVAVADSCPEIIASADYILKTKGGYGAVREFCDLIIPR
jgi:YrbI family 3-deoxy-D-manno-octulosonate 8-phosphate phosphatase